MPERILQLAEQLGKQLADSQQAGAYKSARLSVQADQAAMQLMTEFQTQAEKIAQLEDGNRPIEIADKRRFQQLQEQLAGNQKIKDLTEAQMNYLDLLRQVNQAIHHQLATVEGADGE